MLKGSKSSRSRRGLCRITLLNEDVGILGAADAWLGQGGTTPLVDLPEGTDPWPELICKLRKYGRLWVDESGIWEMLVSWSIAVGTLDCPCRFVYRSARSKISGL